MRNKPSNLQFAYIPKWRLSDMSRVTRHTHTPWSNNVTTLLIKTVSGLFLIPYKMLKVIFHKNDFP